MLYNDNLKNIVNNNTNIKNILLISDFNELNFKQLSGLSNLVFLITNKNNNSKFILKYWESLEEEKYIVYYENILNTYINCGYYNKILYKNLYEKIIIEEYIEKVDFINNNENRLLIMNTLSKINSIQIPEMLSNKKHFFEYYLFDFKVLEKCQKIFNEIKGTWDAETIEISKIILSTDCFINPFLKKIKEFSNLDLCFSHGDFHSLNIIKNKSNNEFIAIDYELSGINFIGYDIINFFMETCFNYDCNQDPYYIFDENNINNEKLWKNLLNSYIYFKNNNIEEKDFDIDKIYNQNFELAEKIFKNRYFLLSLCNFLFIFWSFENIILKGINFNYLEHFKLRYKLFCKFNNK